MCFVSVNKLQPGMVLAEDAKDLTGKLLLSKGNIIEPSHKRILKIWGVTEVNICGDVTEHRTEQITESSYEKIEETKNLVK